MFASSAVFSSADADFVVESALVINWHFHSCK